MTDAEIEHYLSIKSGDVHAHLMWRQIKVLESVLSHLQEDRRRQEALMGPSEADMQKHYEAVVYGTAEPSDT